MGAMLSYYDDLPRRDGDPWNMRAHDPRYDVEHWEVWTPEQHSLNSRKFLVCRCYKSDKFPLCDQSHGALDMQGAKIGPCLLEAQKDMGRYTKFSQTRLEKTPSLKIPQSYYPMDPMQSFEKIDPNVYRYNDYHHLIEPYPETGEKKVRVCRCWQAKRFPICDNTHKALVEAGDSVGPYTAILRPANASRRIEEVTKRAFKPSHAPQVTAVAMVAVATASAAKLLYDKVSTPSQSSTASRREAALS